MRRRTVAPLLVLVWVLLWDRVTPGQIVAGVVVAAVLLVVLRPPGDDPERVGPVRPLGLLRLVVWFAWQFVVSNVLVARAALFPGRHVRPGVVRVPLHTASSPIRALIANITALSPGMQPIGGNADPPYLDVHVLTLRSEDEARAVVHRLEELVLAAFPTCARVEDPR